MGILVVRAHHFSHILRNRGQVILLSHSGKINQFGRSPFLTYFTLDTFFFSAEDMGEYTPAEYVVQQDKFMRKRENFQDFISGAVTITGLGMSQTH